MRRSLLLGFVVGLALAASLAAQNPVTAQVQAALRSLGLLAPPAYTNGQVPGWSTATGKFIPTTVGGGGGSGTVTSVSVVTANGVSGSVATATTTPAITLTLGNITPSGITIGSSGTIDGTLTDIIPDADLTLRLDQLAHFTINTQDGQFNFSGRAFYPTDANFNDLGTALLPFRSGYFGTSIVDTGSLAVTGTTSLDNGYITTDGFGTLVAMLFQGLAANSGLYLASDVSQDNKIYLPDPSTDHLIKFSVNTVTAGADMVFAPDGLYPTSSPISLGKSDAPWSTGYFATSLITPLLTRDSGDLMISTTTSGTIAINPFDGHLTVGGDVTATAFLGPSTFQGTTGSIGGGALTAGTCATGTATVAGAVVGKPVSVSASDGTAPNALATLTASVTATDTVTVQVCAIALVTPTSETYNVSVVQ